MAIASLGYVGFKVSDVAAWSTFATDILGLMPGRSPSGAPRFRTDLMEWRIALEHGAENDIAFAGFEVAGPADLDAIAARLRSSGIEASPATPELLKERGVLGLVRCFDPQGLAIEIFYGATARREKPFVSPAGVSGFLTGEQGIGHIVLSAADIGAVRAFYRDLLGFKLSDVIRMTVGPDRFLDMEFYHCNARHHTLALIPAPTPVRLHHFMLQTLNLDDVGFALDRVNAAKIKITSTLGKHTNDQMVSFYAETPAGFQIEYGWGAREVDAGWRVERHDKTSTWGHKRPTA